MTSRPSADVSADEQATQSVPAVGDSAASRGDAAAPVGPRPRALASAPPAGAQESIETGLSGGEFSTERPISSAVRRTGKVRKARLRLLRVEPWSVMKSAFVLSIAIGITFVVAVAVLWSVIDAAGVFDVVGGLITELTESQASTGFQLTEYIGLTRVVGLATVIAVVDVVLLTALATLFAFLYNLAAALLGGLEVTLAEDD